MILNLKFIYILRYFVLFNKYKIKLIKKILFKNMMRKY